MRDILSRNAPSSRKRSSKNVLRLTGAVIGLGLVLAANPVRAGDDEEEDNRSFERSIIDNLMSGIGAKRNEADSAEYRERSPLVVPSKIDLPPPANSKRKPAPNWPQDPDVLARKAALEAEKRPTISTEQASRPLMPSELAAKPQKRVSSQQINDTKPGGDGELRTLMPSELGYSGGMFSKMFGGDNKAEVKTFKSEPERESLTQPPSGYQTPSSNYAYGIGATKNPDYEEVYDPASGGLIKKPKAY